MGRKLISMLLLLVSASLYAGVLPSRDAEKVAEAFFGSSDTRSGSGLTLVWDGTDNSTKGGGEPYFYVFNHDGGGFVIVAADDAAFPVLGYSHTGSFKVDGMPGNLRGWFDNYRSDVDFIRSKGLSADASTAGMWEEWLSGSVKSPSDRKVLKTASWGQNIPFNNDCPTVDGQKSVTGCTATAVAEVMRYHRYPSGCGKWFPSYEYTTDSGNKRIQAGHIGTFTYRWDDMPEEYGNWSSQENSAVSSLMLDLGVMLHSAYNGTDGNASGTGAYAEDIAPMMVKYMDYDSSAICINRNEMKYARWSSIMKAEIDAGRPVCYSGHGGEIGHMFVLDGYGDDGYFHFNWGWYGQNNGSYRLHAITPDIYDFSNSQCAVVGLKPSQGGAPAVALVYYYVSGKIYGGIRVKSGEVAENNNVTFTVNGIANMNLGTISGTEMGSVEFETAIGLIDRYGNILQTFDPKPFSTLPAGRVFTSDWDFNIRIPSSLSLGDRFVCCYRTRDGEWTVLHPDNSAQNGYASGRPLDLCEEIAAYDFPLIEIDPKGYSDGDVLDLRIINTNRPVFATWYFDGQQIDKEVSAVNLTSGRHTVRAELTVYESNCDGPVARKETLVSVIDVK